MAKTKMVDFTSGLGFFQTPSSEYGTKSTATKTKRIIFTSVGAGITLDIFLGFTAVQIVAGSVVPVSGATSTATIPATTMIVPGHVILTDDQAAPEIWTDNGDGTLTPTGDGTEPGLSGTINYLTGAVSLVYGNDPLITALGYNGYSRYIYATLATAPLGTNPAIIVNEDINLYGRGEVIVFDASGGTPYAEVSYAPDTTQ